MKRGKKSRPARRPGAVLLAIDQGTTGTKAVLLDESLRVLSEASREFRQHFPRPGWVEHDLDEVHASVAAAVEGALRAARVRPSAIAGIGITNQRETTALWDRKSGKPIHRAIVWQDRRTAEDCAELRRRGLEKLFRRRTGLLLDPYFSGTKIAWLLRETRGARARAKAGKLLFGTIDTYLVWRLTGGAAHVTDVSNASRTLLMDLESSTWSEELAEALDVPAAILPEIRANDTVFGSTRGARFLPDGIPIASVIGDQQSALFGQVCFSPGEAKCTYGTGAFLVLNTGSKIVRSRAGLLTTAAWMLGGKPCFALEGSTFVSGAIVQWLRDGLGIIRSSKDVNTLALSVPSSDGVVLVPALTGLGAPHWDPEARGLICGITRGTTAAHIARAALEGIAFQVHDLVKAMERDLGHKLRSLRVDGGGAASDLLMQLQADLLRLRITRPRIRSTTALGTALLAGLTLGIFPSPAAIRKVWKEERSFEPAIASVEREERIRAWTRAVERARGP